MNDGSLTSTYCIYLVSQNVRVSVCFNHLEQLHVQQDIVTSHISYYDLKLKWGLPRCYVDIAVRREQVSRKGPRMATLIAT